MTYASTYRKDARAALLTFLQGFQSANPTLVNQVYRARPATLYPPCLFIGNWSENVLADAQVVTRQPSVDLVLVQGTYDNAETMDRADTAADAFISYLMNNPHVGNGVWLTMRSVDQETEFRGPGGSAAVYLLTVVTIGLDIQEGGVS